MKNKWIQTIEIRPTVRDVVHHVLVFVTLPELRERFLRGLRRITNSLDEKEAKTRR